MITTMMIVVCTLGPAPVCSYRYAAWDNPDSYRLCITAKNKILAERASEPETLTIECRQSDGSEDKPQ